MEKKSVMTIIILLTAFAVQAANQAPVITLVTFPNTVTGKTAAIKVTATDDGGEANLTYTWSITGTTDYTPVTFSPNGTNAAKSTTATFTSAAWYMIKVTVKDKGVPVMNTYQILTIWVQQTPTALNVWPTAITTRPAVPRKFTATVRDQFNLRMNPQPTATWSISSGGFIMPDGIVFTNTTVGSWTVTGKYVTPAGATLQNTATITVAIPNLTTARSKLKNIFIIMQENRSFDNYFGTYPGANGFQRIDLKPVHHHSSGRENEYGHVHSDAVVELAASNYDPTGTFLKPDAFMARYGLSNYDNDCFGYHNGDAGDLCNYWAMADTFVLQDALFESCKSYSKPSHCYMVSGWSANYSTRRTDVGDPQAPVENGSGQFYWNSIAKLLFDASVSWKYYQCLNFQWNNTCGCNASCFASNALSQNGYWLPMTKFPDAKNQANVDVKNLVDNLASNPSAVPKVSWIVPGIEMSEHPQGDDVRKGQKYVTSLVKAIMSSSIWNNCAIFISWDDWGGHYDHAIPPFVSNDEMEGWGIRVPGLMLSPYAKKATGAKKGWVDHEQYSHDAYLKLIEDLFCNSNTISTSDGRTIQPETIVEQGDLLNQFDFSQTPRTNTQPFRNKLVCQQTF